MNSNLSRPAAACPEPFDAIPRSVQQREGLVGNAKRLYAALCTAHRTGWQPTYVELAEHLVASPRSVVRWVRQLVACGLILVRRRGQGRPNLFTVLALVTSGAVSAATIVTPAWRGSTRNPPYKKESGRSRLYSHIPQDARAYLETRTGVLARR